ncbi:MAG: lysophospholipid acyltransferase family protein [bacterium]
MILSLLKIFLIGVAAIPFSIVALISIPLDKSGRTFHLMGTTWGRFGLWLFGVKVELVGAEYIQPGQNYIYVSNHASMFDIPAVQSAIPDQIRIMLKKELTYVPIWGWALKYGPYIVVDRANAKEAVKSLDLAAERMRTGASVLLFAEGTRTRDGKLQPFKRGAFTLAVRSGVPIIPVAINNTFAIMKRGSLKVYPRDITLVLDKPVETAHIKTREEEKELMDYVHRIIEKNYVDQSQG